MKFPRLVYRSAADYLLVSNQDEYDAALTAGWFASVPEAIAGKHDAVVDAGSSPKPWALPPIREELEKQASELSLKFDGRNSNASLQRMIDEALKA